jgi:hypothetical protein
MRNRSKRSKAWHGRHKRFSRRFLSDVRALLPMIGVLFCFVSSATAIFAAERVPLRIFRGETVPVIGDNYSNISMSSTSNVSAAPAGIRPVLRLP